MEGIWAVPWEKVVVRKENLSQRVMATTSQRQVENLLGYRNRIGHRTRGRDNGWRGFIRLNECFFGNHDGHNCTSIFSWPCVVNTKVLNTCKLNTPNFHLAILLVKFLGLYRGGPEPTNRGPLSTCKSGKDSLQPSGIKSPRICR